MTAGQVVNSTNLVTTYAKKTEDPEEKISKIFNCVDVRVKLKRTPSSNNVIIL